MWIFLLVGNNFYVFFTIFLIVRPQVIHNSVPYMMKVEETESGKNIRQKNVGLKTNSSNGANFKQKNISVISMELFCH